MIAAPAEAPLEFTHAEPPLDAFVEPCVAPLIIRINGDTGPANDTAVRVVHASNSGCGAPQVVHFSGAKIVRAEPASAARPGKTARRGFTVVRARF